ncbi:hypothetical protein BDF22DRAFT_739029 [Syncephalis plumigaleata]|nr:hypothetical protein BDF22DRAFT_739029 [Syncephalis plumigaleata]
MSDRATLLEMGFAEAAVDRALKLQRILDYKLPLTAHADDPITEEDAADTETNEDTGELKDDEEGTAQSLVCNDCGKRFRDGMLRIPMKTSWAERHATLSGHVTLPRGRAEKLQELKQRMEQKRELLKQQEREEQKERERIRRLAGKEMIEAKERLKEQEILKAIEAKKKEKLEEKRAREAIKRQIEEDKKERAARRAQASGSASAAAKPTAAAAAAATAPTVTANHNETPTHAIRTTGIHTFAAEAPLEEVMTFVREQAGNSAAIVNLSTTFPRRVMTASDASKTLKELNLVPSSVLVVTIQ